MNEMNDIIQTLNNWTKAYDEGHPEVSDKEWDALPESFCINPKMAPPACRHN